MDFKSFKEKVTIFKNNQITNAANRLLNSSMTIATQEDLEKAIKKSKNTSITVKETWELKVFTKHSVILFLGKDIEQYKKYLTKAPILKTKAWSQNVFFALSSLEPKDLKKYKITEIPSLALWTNEKLEKVIVGEENIKKIEKLLEFDIVKTIKEV